MRTVLTLECPESLFQPTESNTSYPVAHGRSLALWGRKGFSGMGLAVMLCHTPGGMPVIPEERLRCSVLKENCSRPSRLRPTRELTRGMCCRALEERGGKGDPLRTRSKFRSKFSASHAGTLMEQYGGQGGIRTHGTLTRTHAFQACSFDHSDTCPVEKIAYWSRRAEAIAMRQRWQH